MSGDALADLFSAAAQRRDPTPLVATLYGPNRQCDVCGLRFVDAKRLLDHKDFHFKWVKRQALAETHRLTQLWLLYEKEWVDGGGMDVTKVVAEPAKFFKDAEAPVKTKSEKKSSKSTAASKSAAAAATKASKASSKAHASSAGKAKKAKSGKVLESDSEEEPDDDEDEAVVPLGSDPSNCGLCGQRLDVFRDDDEQWLVRGAVRARLEGSDSAKLYHLSCAGDLSKAEIVLGDGAEPLSPVANGTSSKRTAAASRAAAASVAPVAPAQPSTTTSLVRGKRKREGWEGAEAALAEAEALLAAEIGPAAKKRKT